MVEFVGNRCWGDLPAEGHVVVLLCGHAEFVALEVLESVTLRGSVKLGFL